MEAFDVDRLKNFEVLLTLNFRATPDASSEFAPCGVSRGWSLVRGGVGGGWGGLIGGRFHLY